MRAFSVAAWKGRKISSFYGIFMSCSCQWVFFSSPALLFASYLYIWHCGDNTIMNNMIYGGGPFEKSPSRVRRNHVLAIRQKFFFSEGHNTHDKETHFECNMKKKRKHAVANYFIESEMNDLITHDSKCFLFSLFSCRNNDNFSTNDEKKIRMRAMHMHDNKW